eukprot:7770086-Alexandrium_andersonii.AAC.1
MANYHDPCGATGCPSYHPCMPNSLSDLDGAPNATFRTMQTTDMRCNDCSQRRALVPISAGGRCSRGVQER